MRAITFILLAIATLWLATSPPVYAQEEPTEKTSEKAERDEQIFSQPVIVDGNELFFVRGSTALPASERAEIVANRIIEFAESSESETVQMEVRSEDLGFVVYADDTMITVTTQADSEFEQMEMNVLASLQAEAIQRAILDYRANRTDAAFAQSTTAALVWSAMFAAYCVLLIFLRKRVPRFIARIVERRFHVVQAATMDVLQASAASNLVSFGIRVLIDVTLFTGFYYYISFVLHSFPQTQPIAELLIRYVTDPILGILLAIIAYVPNLITIAIIVGITAWIIKGVKLFFENVDQGTIALKNFEAHWIWPTYNLIRLTLILICAVFCFPYIPGSDSAAFQGLTILVGVMVSLGSNSVISNVLAGLFVLYKRSMNVGDRIRVGEHYGDVMQIKLMETYLKSVKNELISIPNATLLSSEVINYSSKIDGKGLLLHTTVGIGYEEPRAKVEAMLVEAARRTNGLKKSPAPFVLVTALADYAMNYQINAFTTRGSYLPLLLSELHKHISDVFNENGVQIMTPSYMADTPELKISDPNWEGDLASPDDPGNEVKQTG
ncbi:mechanosensitive ion channel family protein [Shimia abyssi]|uniref:Small-conductance mechanosensitive channel n=1 Tax=Shimia abyssi TaxID=1662395 RepID=A0A2P8F062_9RHOB|nr:mechanosensitive ion channel domain-containing protein [Shimia abyssi]PSL15093.1 mechanosensitive ion channel-like protein [Shimia abyssi]